ncbi:MAG: NTP transferase domain-containing protein [Deltaproteobacteria bacterium]|nr:NTP transferase domain-containing protein [Deltaproteobacteria bacterium]
MLGTGQSWVIVLAGGEGRRLQSLTRDEHGVAVPKQYCALHGQPSFFQTALARARQLVPPERIVIVVAESHWPWWMDEAEALTFEHLLVQPLNRGTAVGIFLPLLHILQHDPEAHIVVLPSDHFIEDESVVRLALEEALLTTRQGRHLVLLGVTPEYPDTEYGWIVPGSTREGNGCGVEGFREKPTLEVATALMARGAVWNSFMFAARGEQLLRFYLTCLPQVARMFLRRFSAGLHSAALEPLRVLYEGLPTVDFSADLLERMAQQLWMLPVPACGWSDLGTPERIAEVCARYFQIPCEPTCLLLRTPPPRRQPAVAATLFPYPTSAVTRYLATRSRVAMAAR